MKIVYSLKNKGSLNPKIHEFLASVDEICKDF